MKQLVAYIAALIICITCPAWAGSNPDFSGTWVLDPVHSDLGKMAGAAQMPLQKIVLVLRQTEKELAIERNSGSRKEITTYKLDGSESLNPLSGGSSSTTTMKWENGCLHGKTLANYGGKDVEIRDVRSLSPDGKTMNLNIERKAGAEIVRQTLVYTKEMDK